MESTERAVERLTADHSEVAEGGHIVEWPPLLVWLRERITEINSQGNGSTGPGVPLNNDALDLHQHIQSRLRKMREALNLVGSKDALRDVVAVWEHTQALRNSGLMEDRQWEMICDEFPDWVMRIECEQNRPRKMELTVACPRCDTRWVLDNGDRKAAVVIEFAEGRAPVAECRVEDCAAIWGGWAEVAKLGFTVGAEADLAVLAACGIDAPQIGIT